FAYDPIRHRALVFGGCDGTQTFGDTWLWDSAARRWANVTPVAPGIGPSPRYDAAIAYDETRRAIVLTGGFSDTGIKLADTWLWDGDQWTLTVEVNAAPARSGHVMTYDAVRSELVSLG